MNISVLKMSIRKELWEFKKLLFWVPIIMMALIVMMPVLQFILLEDYQWSRILLSLRDMQDPSINMPIGQIAFAAMSGLFVPFMIISLLVQLYYFLTCLFDERRDLSIYFWRSMPVSDALTVGVKLLTGSFVIPAVFLLAATGALVLTLILAVIACIFLAVGYDISIWHVWGHLDIFSSLALVWVNIIPLVLWLFPVFAWLMLASMFANKAPFLWAILPVVVVILLEVFVVNYFGLSTAYFSQTLMNYFGITEHGISLVYTNTGAAELMPFNILMSKVSVAGLLIGTGLMYITYWLRANRSHG